MSIVLKNVSITDVFKSENNDYIINSCILNCEYYGFMFRKYKLVYFNSKKSENLSSICVKDLSTYNSSVFSGRLYVTRFIDYLYNVLKIRKEFHLWVYLSLESLFSLCV